MRKVILGSANKIRQCPVSLVDDALLLIKVTEIVCHDIPTKRGDSIPSTYKRPGQVQFLWELDYLLLLRNLDDRDHAPSIGVPHVCYAGAEAIVRGR